MQNTKDARKTKREAAHQRNTEYRKLTTDQKIQRTKSRRGNSSKELKRLELLKEKK